jgi:hypothetical protein
MQCSLAAAVRTVRILVLALVLAGLAQLPQTVVLAAPAADDDDVADPFLMRLLDEINLRRDAVGTQRLAYVPRPANDALGAFLGQTAPTISWPQPCMHQLVGGEYSWDYINATTGFDAEARGEVLACPGPEPYWTPDRAAEQWWDSPVHFEVLYGDGAANAVACSAYGAQGSGGKKRNSSAAAMAVLCVTFHE